MPTARDASAMKTARRLSTPHRAPRRKLGRWAWTHSTPLTLALLFAGCSDDGAASETTDGGSTGVQLPAEGLFGCPSGEDCTLLVVSQSLDDRVEVFSLAGPGPRYRGAMSLDFEPNPAGDISNDALDEPFEFAALGDRFAFAVGHFPSRERGLVLDADFARFSDLAPGATASAERLRMGDSFAPGVGVYAPELREAIHIAPLPSGRLLVSAFENDLFDAASTWTRPGAVAILDPATESWASRGLDSFDDAGCSGAWRAIPLDGDRRYAIACDGEPGGVLMLDASSEAEADLEAAVEGLRGCVANLSSAGRQLRYLAPAPGGVLLADSPASPDQSAAVLWSFDEDCQLLGAAQWDGPTLWDFRALERDPARSDRWALLNARGDARGVHIVDESGQSCRRIDALDSLWPEGHEPLALRWTPDGSGLVVSAGPAEALDATGAPGGLWWLELAAGEDPCDAPLEGVEDLLEGAPAYDASDPATWRRAGASLSWLDTRP